MEKIGVIGLGNIAQKAYLPTMATLQDKFEWHLTTRNKAKGEMLEKKYGFKHFHQTLDELIAEKPLAVFVLHQRILLLSSSYSKQESMYMWINLFLKNIHKWKTYIN